MQVANALTHTRSISVPEPLHLRDDGRTVEGVIVPWNSPAEVVEPDASGKLVRITEAFRPTSFGAMSQQAAKRGNWGWMRLTMDHDEATERLAGFARTVEVDDTGATASFRLYKSRNLELFQSMIEESHDGLSIEFNEIVPAVTDERGVTWQRQVWVNAVATTPVPTYAAAGVTAMRSGGGQLDTPALDEVEAWLVEQGRVTLEPES